MIEDIRSVEEKESIRAYIKPSRLFSSRVNPFNPDSKAWQTAKNRSPYVRVRTRLSDLLANGVIGQRH